MKNKFFKWKLELLRVIILCGFLFSLNLGFSENKTDNKKEDVRSLMHDFYQRVIELKTILMNRDEFVKEENQKKLTSLFLQFEGKLDELKKYQSFSQSEKSAVIDLFHRHLIDTNQFIANRDFDSSFQKIKQTTDFCLTCHTRLPQVNDAKLDWKKDFKVQSLSDALSAADFYYVTRRYEWSVNIYDHLIRSYPESILKEKDLREVYFRKLLVFARVWRDPVLAERNLKQDLENKKLPLNSRREVENWKKSFSSWSQEIKSQKIKNNPLNEPTREQIVILTKKTLQQAEGDRGPSGAEPHLVSLLRVSGLLYQNLSTLRSNEEKSETLYYLGKIERILAQSSFASLSDLYLKECIRSAPSSIWSKDCLSEYQKYLNFKYPQIALIPASIKSEMKNLEEMINKTNRNNEPKKK